MIRRTHDSFVRANFRGRLGRLTDPVVDRFEQVESDDRDTTLATIAFLFGNSDPLKLNKLGLQTSMLALYAAGASVTLTRDELWELSSELRQFVELYRLPEMMSNPNGRILQFVFNQAMQRGARDSIQCGSKGELPLGFKLIRLQAAASCSSLPDSDDRRTLFTIAFGSLHPDPMQVSAQSLAVAMLAIWSAGAKVSLSFEQYQELKHLAGLLAHSPARAGAAHACKMKQAALVLEKAALRAESEGLEAELALAAV
ncbi:MAG: hypothetical protein K2X27_26775 [Candidatus Obscuribacterales bacterium]|nr:hypothetical protein [Candidatus Obscuribacterales bacterium]